MGRKIIFFIICTFFLIPSTVLASPKINSPSAILVNSKAVRYFMKKVHDKHYPASITKVMTAILLLEEGNLEKVVTIGDDVPF